MKSSTKAAVSGLCTALSVVLLFCTSLLYIFTYVVPMVLSVLMMSVKKTFSASCAWCVYIGVSVLSMILVPEKEAVLMYVLFFGYYPIIKSGIEKIKPAALAFIVKLFIFNISVTAVEVIAYFVFSIPFFEDGVFSSAMLVLFAVLMNVIFILYEFLLKNFMVLYEKKLEKHILKIFKI